MNNDNTGFYLGLIILILGGLLSGIAAYHYAFRTKKIFNIFAVLDYDAKEKKIFLISVILMVMGMIISIISN